MPLTLDNRSPHGIALEGVTRVLGGKRVLDGLDLHVAPGSRLGIVGRSGAGKSTLLGLVAGLDEPDAGTVTVFGDTGAAGTARALRADAAARLPAAMADGTRQRVPRAREPGRAARRSATPGRAALRSLPARRCRIAAPSAVVGRHAPARRLPANAARGQGRAAARRAVRSARRDHAVRAAGVADRTCSQSSRERCCSSRTTSRRRCSSAIA